MKPINLLDYAKYSQKISSPLLKYRETKKVKIPTWKIFAAYFWDFGIIVTTTFIMASIYGISAEKFMLTHELTILFGEIKLAELTQLILPMNIFCYFFFSYFFNDGQTWGMNLFKTRLKMPSKELKNSFHWALYSSALLYTGGLIYPFTKFWLPTRGFGSFETHDYLYHTLVEETFTSPVNLLNEIAKFEKEVVTEDFKIVA